MPTDNKQRLWAFGPPRLLKRMPRVKIAAAGCYVLNGTSVLRSIESLHSERIVEVLEAIDSNRVVDLIEYFESYVDYLVVALLPEDASALDGEHTFITEL